MKRGTECSGVCPCATPATATPPASERRAGEGDPRSPGAWRTTLQIPISSDSGFLLEGVAGIFVGKLREWVVGFRIDSGVWRSGLYGWKPEVGEIVSSTNRHYHHTFADKSSPSSRKMSQVTMPSPTILLPPPPAHTICHAADTGQHRGTPQLVM
eukprot:861709-Pelagomonas_calceolata.AAC.2